MAKVMGWCEGIVTLLVIALFMCRDSTVHAKKKSADVIKKCETCRNLVTKFQEGMDRTDRYNFAGGDVDWEEKKLGSYATSETRFIEITEQLCGSKHECNAMFEEQEENLEEWWKGHQETDPDLLVWLCIDKMKVCCPDNRYGPECEECLGGLERPCRDNGKCSGGGTRGGTGKCKCNGGYKGTDCEICKNGFYEVSKNETHTDCKVCDDSCSSTCTGAGPQGCNKCKSGYERVEEEGCKDIDECLTYPCSEKEFCENNKGSHKCVECHASCNKCEGDGNTGCLLCRKGYERVDGACKDINECKEEGICEEGMVCHNLPGRHFCDCADGFERMGEECVDTQFMKDLQSGKMMELPDPELGLKDTDEAGGDNTETTEQDPQTDQEETSSQESNQDNSPSFQENTNTNTPDDAPSLVADELTKDTVPQGDDLTVKEGSFQSHQNQEESQADNQNSEQYQETEKVNTDSLVVDADENVDTIYADGENLNAQSQDGKEEL